MEGEFRGGTGASEGRHGLVSSLPGLLQSHSQRVGVGVGKHPATPLGAESEKHGGREDCWSEAATFTLIEAWGNHYLELNRGNLKQKHWKEVAEAVNAREEGKVGKTDVQCKNRLDTLKKKYKLEKNKLAEAGGNGSSKWPFFHKLDELIGTFRKHKKCALLPADKHAKSWGSPSGQHQRRGGAALKEGEDKVVVAYQNAASASTKSKESPDMTDSCPHALEDDDVGTGGGGAANGGATRGTHAGEGTSDRATEAKSFKKRKLQDEPFKDLARAIIKFAEVYERIESAKQRQLSELEKQRMEFTKDLELKRMQLFMQTQVEIAKLKHAKHGSTEHYATDDSLRPVLEHT